MAVNLDVPQGATVSVKVRDGGEGNPAAAYHELSHRRQLPHVSGRRSSARRSWLGRCALLTAEGQVIKTDSPMVKKAR